ncbi:MAG: Ni/Fe hydrogenase subunit alpha [Candidatus Thermoplasmatota archaeon]|jgi:coenzyme F420-reducing hydrogenase alpha subunit|nr:Ni/Fe hydrogenase subunit alpha [Candidatus Thermoplasmatota archaeon]
MSNDFSVHVEHLTRVEGHGNIELNVKNGKIEKLQWSVIEAPRFFEAMLRGQHYNELRPITSRICGICSIGHSLASLKATEDALGVKITEQTALLRRLAIHGENMQSHILHIGYLVAPDLFGVGSVFHLIGTKYKETVLKIVKLHRLANEMSDIICGRTIHPIRLVVGGFSVLPNKKQLLDLRKRLEESKNITNDLAMVIKSVADKFPSFKRETEYIGLSAEDEYALYDGVINSTDTGTFKDYKNYQKITNEYVVPQSTAKYTKHARKSYMVGALARFNLNSKNLHPAAKEIAKMFNLKPINYNPFMNTIAQLVEFVHSTNDSINLIDKILEKGLKEEKPIKPKVKASKGVGIVEVPRGILIHDYTLNSKGYCIKANCIIPTNQNHANIQFDMEKIVPEIIDRPQKEIELTLEMLVRAYDPCISCSTHYLDVKFV